MQRSAFFLLVLLFATACESGNEGSLVDVDGPEPDVIEDAGVLVRDVPQSADVFSDPDVSIDTYDEPSSIFEQPDDGRTYAAAGVVLITPDGDNHPCVDYIGGTGQNRISEGVHTDLEARAIVMAQGEEHVVMVALDLIGWEKPDTERVLAYLEPLGVQTRHVLLSSTHTHNALDTIGVWGPDDFETGRCPSHNEWLAETVAHLIIDLADEMVPVTVQAAESFVHEPESNFANLVSDSREPRVTNDHFVVARLADDEDQTVATIVNWHTHPEAMIHEKVISADFPHWTRNAVEDVLGGTCVYFSGTVGGLQTCMTVAVPERDEDGSPVLEEGEPVWVEQDGYEKERSMGWYVADFALATLDDAPVIDGELSIDVERLEIPFENMMMIIGVQSGLIENYEGIVTDDSPRCGIYGCMPWDVHHIRYGLVHIVDLPGELFPESSVGRDASSHDFSDEGDGDHGVWEFPAIDGYRSALPEGHLLIEIGLCNQELGYLVPDSDFLPSAHPGNYEEYFCVSRKAEQLVREGVRAILLSGTAVQ